MRRTSRTSILLATTLLASCRGGTQSTSATDPMPTGASEAPLGGEESDEPEAPSLEDATAWLGVEQPLELAKLRGQLVILDFWTYCCINCMHVLPLLAEIEEAFEGEPVVVIGVHSAKFDGERDPDRILDAMRRYGVRHPVAVDSDMRIWNRYRVRAWPTLVVIRPNGRIAAVAPGEPDRDLLHRAVRSILEEARADGSLADGPVLELAPAPAATGPLAFPGKVVSLPDGGLAISDSGHHRILLLDRDGRVRDTIGNGLRGWADGGFAGASFDDPQGIAVAPDGILYVADVRNHVIRRIDGPNRRVETIAGTGAKGLAPLDDAPLSARATALRSPWDVALSADAKLLYVALAGNHQIAVLDRSRGTIRRLAGSGREDIIDGPPAEAAFAQPSGLSLARSTLYVADSETSSVRAIDLKSRHARTLVGKGLFAFGDADGPLAEAKLQHPLAVQWDGRGIIVVDTYNHKLKRIDPRAQAIASLYSGSGELELREPSGVVRERDGSLVVTDTGNGRLLRIDKDGSKAKVITIVGAPPALRGRVRKAAEADTKSAAARVGPKLATPLAPGPVELVIEMRAPDAHEFSAGSPLDLRLRSGDGRMFAEHHGTATAGRSLTVPLAATLDPKSPTELALEVRAVACDTVDHSFCRPMRKHFIIELPSVSGGAAGHSAAYSLVLSVEPERARTDLR